jgi:hypothetical protein
MADPARMVTFSRMSMLSELMRSERLERDFRPRARSVLARVGTALAITSVGALALGAVAVGALAIGALAVKRARIQRLELDELVIGGQPFPARA